LGEAAGIEGADDWRRSFRNGLGTLMNNRRRGALTILHREALSPPQPTSKGACACDRAGARRTKAPRAAIDASDELRDKDTADIFTEVPRVIDKRL
jgi:hypothetical protein